MRNVRRGIMWGVLALLCLASWSAAGRQNGAARGSGGVSVDKTSIGGTVVNSNGGKPEAGVWVIAETKSLQTLIARASIALTPDR
jgi:hypothetical protein